MLYICKHEIAVSDLATHPVQIFLSAVENFHLQRHHHFYRYRYRCVALWANRICGTAPVPEKTIYCRNQGQGNRRY